MIGETEQRAAELSCPNCNALQTIDAETQRRGGIISCARCGTDIDIDANLVTTSDQS